MEFDKIKNKGQARLFQNDFLELMTKTHPLIVYSMYFPVIGYMLYTGFVDKGLSAGAEIILFFSGVLFWTFFEYIMHRYVFHMVLETAWGRRIVYTMHGVHHEYPRDKNRLFMPPVPSIVLATIIYFAMRMIMGANSMAFFPGFVFGYMLYGSMHYAIHAFHPPKFMKALWRNHHLHHYKHPDKGFGVSSVIWDVVFRTVPNKEAE